MMKWQGGIKWMQSAGAGSQGRLLALRPQSFLLSWNKASDEKGEPCVCSKSWLLIHDVIYSLIHKVFPMVILLDQVFFITIQFQKLNIQKLF